MMLLLWMPRAREERHAAIERIALENVTAAINQLDEIMSQTDLLLQHPELGRLGRRPGTRELLINHSNFIVVYRFKPRAKRIEIWRVLHTSQAWPLNASAA